MKLMKDTGSKEMITEVGNKLMLLPFMVLFVYFKHVQNK